jgi:RND superfamily putative drug exporter
MPNSRTAERGRKGARGGALRRLGEWCARHFVIAIIAWLVALVALQVVSREFGGSYSDNFSLPQAQTQKGLEC